MSRTFTIAAAAAVLATPLALGGCANTAASGAGQMRIDVAVYKGPLAKEPDVQWGELLGVIEEAQNGLIVLEKSALDYARYSFKAHVLRSYEREIKPSTTTSSTVERSLGLGWCDAPKRLLPEEGTPPIDLESFRTFLSSAAVQLDYYDRMEKFRQANRHWKNTLSKCRRILELYADIHDARTIVADLLSNALNWNQWYSSNLAQITDTYSAALSRLKTASGEGSKTDAALSMAKCRTGDIEGCPDPDLRQLVQETDNLAVEMRSTIKEVARVSYRLKQKAATWAGDHLRDAEPDKQVRQLLTFFSIIAAEYSNQMSSKADALLKQMQPRGNDRGELPLSVHLRDASSTTFASLALSQHAVGRPLAQEEGDLGYALARLRVFEQLYDDDSWSRVNTVHAVGRGEVRMAFIKDDIGNWNLKRFDNDPTELLDAYKQVGLAALKTATTVVSGGAGGVAGVGGAQRLLGLANQVALGGAAPGEPALGNKTVSQLHQGVVDRLNRLRAEMVEKQATLTAEVEELDKTLETRNASVTETEAEIEAKRNETNGETAAGKQAEASAQTRLAELLRQKAADLPADDPRRAELEADAVKADGSAEAATARAGALTKLETEIAALKETQESREKDADKAEKDRDGKKAELDTIAKTTAEQAELILERHGLIVDELESATVSDAQTPAAPAPATNPLSTLLGG